MLLRINEIDDLLKTSNDAGPFGNQKRMRFGQSQEGCVSPRWRKILSQDLLQFLHVGMTRLKKIGDNPFSLRKVFWIADDWHAFCPRIFAGPHDLNGLGIDLNNGKAVGQQGALDRVNRLVRSSPAGLTIPSLERSYR